MNIDLERSLAYAGKVARRGASGAAEG